ncbi:MAG TPA: 5-amino-6-(D-ribitylamino)uracil--L-tyrosine 4-hydroxyphenyl transferase CofH [Bryobacteraceae bacterium]|jgi:FO synthase subunit 2|nr:5-amino-6-(D-ribitylamino)uracil--L-tyrosine 4-hydroxyphenyl transferase CofH [Bryobacteraceae bacterium]
MTGETNIAVILQRAAAGRELSIEDAAALFAAEGDDLQRLVTAADQLRRRRVGDQVAYVVNRNINFTNVCVKRCGFCAFSRGHRAEEGYFLPLEEVLRRVHEAKELGATEVCIQAGLPPRIPGSFYIDLCAAIKREVPDIHVHAFSPEEILYGATLSGSTVEAYLAKLKDVGLGSLPGTSAEILDDRLREVISPGRISTREWMRVIRSAHQLGIRTTVTIMYGHMETALDLARHVDLVRGIQKETGGFTEFVPLSFIAAEAPMVRKSLVSGVRASITREDVLRMYATARLMLDPWISNIQATWVKQGPQLAQECLQAGANDFGGTLMNESISTSAGAGHGQFLRPAEIRRWIREAGRIPVQRSTTYQTLRVFEEEPAEPEAVWSDDRFGSYGKLIASDQFRFRARQ